MPFITLAVDGGLDLLSAPVTVVPGRAQACSNFEVALRAGLKSVDGYERFDGGVSPSSTARLWRADLSGFEEDSEHSVALVDQDFVGKYGRIIYANDKGVIAVLTVNIVYTELTSTITGAAYFTTINSSDSLILSNLIGGYGYTFYDAFFRMYETIPFDSVAYTRDDIVADAQLTTASASIEAKSAYYDLIREDVQEVPGQDNVLGLFWLKDELYACRDYFALAYEDSVSVPDYNDELFIGADYGTATWKGFLAKDVVQNSGSPSEITTNSGLMMFYNTTGTATLATLKNRTQGDIDVATVTEVGAASQGAGLYRADGGRGDDVDTQSWTHQDIGYRVDYDEGQAEFVPANRISPRTDIADLIKETNWVVPDILQSLANTWIQGADPLPGSWSAFPSADGLQQDDGDDSFLGCLHTAGGTRAQFQINDFGLSDTDIPAGSTITGFTLEITRRAYRGGTATGNIRDHELSLVFAPGSGVTGTTSKFGDKFTNWPSSALSPDGGTYAPKEYGGPQKLLGYGNVTPDAVKSADFGFRMNTNCDSFGAGTYGVQARITMVRLKVHFVPPQSKIYFWDADAAAPSAVTAEVVAAYPISGEVANSDAAGSLFLMDVGTNRAVAADEQIRTMPIGGTVPDGGADGSTLIAMTQTSVTKNVMDWGALLHGQGSKYQYVTHNFYAAATFDAIYGVSGTGPAFMYDGYAFTRIMTGTPVEYELPRHVITHQQRMFLGYGSGQYMWSEPGDPLIFDALTGTSAEDGVGSSIRGFMQLNGDALAIFHQTGVAMIQGDVGLTPYPGVITADVGCAEYSAQSMGNYMYMSFRGAQNLRSTPAYGDFDHAQFSWDVWDWLRPRVQTSAFFESANIGLINSYPVKNKSQCRWCFADGAQLTATFLREGENTQLTIQNITNSEGNPLTWDVVTAGVESNGRDRIFGATNDGTGYVYEIDRGYSFDGANIDAYATLVVMDQGSPQQYKEFTDMQVHGKATDYATFTTSRAVNYGEPDPTKRYTNRFGSLTAVPSGEERYYSSAIPIRNMGRNLVLRFDRSSNDQPPVTIQAISYNIVPAGEKQT